jgi:fused signal recognition particle receptor
MPESVREALGSLIASLVGWAEAHPAEVTGLVSGLALAVIALAFVWWRSTALRASEPEAAPGPAAAEVEPTPAALAPPAVGVAPLPQTAPPGPQVAPPVPEVVPPVAPPAPAEPQRPRPLRERLARTREALAGRLGSLLGGGRVDAAVLDDLETVLLGADLGVATVDALLAEVRRKAQGADAGEVRRVLQDAVRERLERVEPRELAGIAVRARPHVILVLGVNGSGKTTTIGKLAARHVAAGRKVVLGAADTFRAAATQQLEVWGERAGCEVVAGGEGGDPAAVAFDAVKTAVGSEADVALIDTAGRLQTRRPLMEELSKIVRVVGRELPGAPHEVLLVLDANTGQNAISQARLFTEVAGVTGIVLTKLDGTARGGVIVGLADAFGIPVKYVGVGEGVEDLRDFSARDFVDAMFEDPGDPRGA